jgi:signal transduction histidine kinase
MKDLVESLFELTKVSSGVVESKKEKIDLVRLLEQTIGLFDDQLIRTGLVVRRNYFSDTILIITDGGRMHQVFANLLDNAIKYALEGTRIYLEVKETKDSYLVRMTNTSSYEMDFTPDEIMQRFARGDKARSTKGSGLGLAIAQTYTESAGGSFRISPDGDQFSAIVELPKIERNL